MSNDIKQEKRPCVIKVKKIKELTRQFFQVQLTGQRETEKSLIFIQ